MPAWAKPDTRGQLRLTRKPNLVRERDEVHLRVLACGLSRTDLQVVDKALNQHLAKVTPGHQIVGGFTEVATAPEGFAFQLPPNANAVEVASPLCTGIIGHRAVSSSTPTRLSTGDIPMWVERPLSSAVHPASPRENGFRHHLRPRRRAGACGTSRGNARRIGGARRYRRVGYSDHELPRVPLRGT